jgi:hypothetical protein
MISFIFFFIFAFSSSSCSSCPPLLPHVNIYWFVLIYPKPTHQISNSAHYNEHRKDQEKHLDSCSTLLKSAWLTGARTTTSYISAPFSTHALLLTYTLIPINLSFLSPQKSLCASTSFCSKCLWFEKRMSRGRKRKPGVQGSDFLPLKGLLDETIWNVWFLERD